MGYVHDYAYLCMATSASLISRVGLPVPLCISCASISVASVVVSVSPRPSSSLKASTRHLREQNGVYRSTNSCLPQVLQRLSSSATTDGDLAAKSAYSGSENAGTVERCRCSGRLVVRLA